MRIAGRLALVALLVLSGLRTAEAARISINEQNEGGGTIINDGTGDVATTNGTTTLATSNTDLMSVLGLTNLTLAADLANLHITGAITDPFVQNFTNFPAVTANLNVLRITGTLAQPCANCGTLDNVKVASTLGLQFINGVPFNPASVLFAFDIVGNGFNNVPWGLAGGLPTQTVGIGAPLDFQLTAAQISFIVSRMNAYGVGVDQVRIGLGAGSVGFTEFGDEEPTQTDFEIRPVPEPTTLLLLGAGLASAGVSRLRRRSARH